MSDIERSSSTGVCPGLYAEKYNELPILTTTISTTTTTTTTTDSITVSTKVKRLYSWNEIPIWQRDNEHIVSGYVRETNSLTGCLRSLLYLHNESVNIYTHLIPAICCLVLLFLNKSIVVEYPTTSLRDYLIIDVFFLGLFTCLMMSSLFHCTKCHSERVAALGNKLDYLGICVLVSTSMISILYYGFYGDLKLFATFCGITVVFGLLCAVVSLREKFRAPEWRAYRAALFVAFGLSAVFPIIGGVVNYGFFEAWTRIQMKWVLLEGVFYIFGAFLYGVRFPEVKKPGAFDIWGHSHQIFHVLVVVAAMCHLKGLLGSYRVTHVRLVPEQLGGLGLGPI